MKQYYRGPVRKIRVINCMAEGNKVTYSIEEKKKENSDGLDITPFPEYAEILDNSEIIEEVDFYYNRRHKLLTAKTDFPVTCIEDVPDIITYDILVRKKQETEVIFINPAELTKVKREEIKEKPMQCIKTRFRKK